MLTEEEKQKITRFAIAGYCPYEKRKASMLSISRRFRIPIILLDDCFNEIINRLTLLGESPEYFIHIKGNTSQFTQTKQSYVSRVFHDTHATWFHNHALDYEEPYLEKRVNGETFTYDMSLDRFV